MTGDNGSTSKRGSSRKTNLPLSAGVANDRPFIITRREIAAGMVDKVRGQDSHTRYNAGEDKKAAIDNAHRCHLPRLMRSIVTNAV